MVVVALLVLYSSNSSNCAHKYMYLFVYQLYLHRAEYIATYYNLEVEAKD